MEAYLDNAATTQCFSAVRDIVEKTLCGDYGNPSSMHGMGITAEQYIKRSKKILNNILKSKDKEIIFTSGGTESDNLAIIGAALANKRQGMHCITTAVEHPAVLRAMKYLESIGFQVTYLPVDCYGVVSLKELENAICEHTILISVMYVNNEIGAVQPIEEIHTIISDKKQNILFHVDAIQAFGKYPIHPKKQGIDLLSVSGHKIHGPKGVGFLYAREGVKISPILFGGGQQKDMRPGTENVPGIAGIGAAAEQMYAELNKNREHLYRLRCMFLELVQRNEGVQINGYLDERNAPHIVSASFAGVRSEVLLHALEERKVYVSSGSACSSNKKSASSTLEALGIAKELLDATIRFSFSVHTTEEEIRYSVDQITEILPILRRYSRN